MSEFMKMIEAQNATIREYESAKKAYQAKLKAEFEPIFKAFFEAFPEISMIAWTQYTPYFNDGDPCVFRVGEQIFVATGAEEESDEDIDSIYDLEYLPFPYVKPADYVFEKAATGDSYYVPKVKAYEDKKAELGDRFDEVCAGVKAMRDYLSFVPEEIYLAAFDDHVEVRATKDGIDVNEFAHD